jgi:hypothetical protein
MKLPHPIELRRHLIKLNPQYIQGIIDQENKEMDPNYFLELSKIKYGDLMGQTHQSNFLNERNS